MKNTKLNLIIFSSLILMCIFSCIQLCHGSYEITIKDVIYSLFDKDIWNFNYISYSIFGENICNFFNIEKPINEISTNTLILWNIRLPRILVGILVGINLSLAGCIFQTITQNEMASPYTLGISQGSRLSYNVNISIFSTYDIYDSFLCNDRRNNIIFNSLYYGI